LASNYDQDQKARKIQTGEIKLTQTERKDEDYRTKKQKEGHTGKTLEYR